jgi:hypothetical protein
MIEFDAFPSMDGWTYFEGDGCCGSIKGDRVRLMSARIPDEEAVLSRSDLEQLLGRMGRD